MTRETETPTTDDSTDPDDRQADQGDRPRDDAGGPSLPGDVPPGDDPADEAVDSAAPDGVEPGPGSRTTPDPPTPAEPSTGGGVDTDADADVEGVLTPADLERVAEQVRDLDDERVLVPTDGTDGEHGPEPSPSSDTSPRDGSPSGRRSRRREVGKSPAGGADSPDGLAGASLDAETAYAVDVTVRTDHGLAAESFQSNDVRAVFEELLRWYAGRIEPGTDPERVLEVLLAASGLDVTVR